MKVWRKAHPLALQVKEYHPWALTRVGAYLARLDCWNTQNEGIIGCILVNAKP